MGIEDMPVFVIKGKDMLASQTIAHYRNLCSMYGLDSQAIEVQRALDEMYAWQERNPELMGAPDHPHVPVQKSVIPDSSIADSIEENDELCGCCDLLDYAKPEDDTHDVSCETCGHTPEEHARRAEWRNA